MTDWGYAWNKHNYNLRKVIKMNESGDGAQNKLDVFVSDLLAAKVMADDPETHAELLEQVESVVNQAVIEALPSDDISRLEYLVNNNPTEAEITDLMENADFNAEAVIKRTLESFRDKFLRGGENE